MPASLSTLVQLLRDFHGELRACLDRENSQSIKEPILLGDFIAEAYNSYLSQAKDLCDDPIVQSLPEITPSGSTGMEGNPRGEQADCRLQKMGEVSLATRSLLTALQGMNKHSKPSEPKEVRETMALLNSLEIALGYGTQTREACNAIVDQYNRCLVLLQEVLQDPVLQSVFPRLEPVTVDGNELQDRFSELRRARQALFGYIANLRASGRLATPGPEDDSMADTEAGGS